MHDFGLTKLDAASRMLAEIKSLPEALEVVDLAAAAQTYARKAKLGLEAQNHAAEIKLRAERKAGEYLAQLDRAKNQYAGATLHEHSPYTAALNAAGADRFDANRWQKIADAPDDKFEEYIEHTKSDGKELTTSGAVATLGREQRRAEVRERLESTEAMEAKEASGVYDVIVIDPPWLIEKIERDERPNQTGLDYPTMQLYDISQLELPSADDCHVWLWATHKHLPDAFWLLEEWGLKYVCTFVWHKPGGFQPFDLPQYNCEFALYARRGSPMFLDTKDFPTCFNAPRGAHSEKPEHFYNVIRRVTSGRRLDMFNRRLIEGFDGWGKEAVA